MTLVQTSGTTQAQQPQRPRGLPRRPQVHSSKHHHTYNGVRSVPSATWVRSQAARQAQPESPMKEEALVVHYEVILYYPRNRACTIHRTLEDFEQLRQSMPELKDSSSEASADGDTLASLDSFLRNAVRKRRDAVALEYFLRRRIGDCQ
ncbi:uncharacterized protein E0L32_001037 [Thyridium curvatum]|uniref:PX domain-containing protein n=1 Tax=Thyridium curvatum TaxID=1093900 RepID=A0A507B1Q6_9PEZI|nr:uncharacterized protein E0L32_001037 [Thyridium curvatum]TPX11219.1 hypothetical protein E0L32_001037 [Thyridium curvatum]